MSTSGEQNSESRFPFRVFERDGSFHTLLITANMTASQICELAKTKLYKNNPAVTLVLFEKAGDKAVREVKGSEYPGEFYRIWRGRPDDLQYFLIVRVTRLNLMPLSPSGQTVVSSVSLPVTSSVMTSAAVSTTLSPRAAGSGAGVPNNFVAVGPTASSQQSSFLGNSRLPHNSSAAAAAAAGSNERVMFVRNTQHPHPNALPSIPQPHLQTSQPLISQSPHYWQAPAGLAPTMNSTSVRAQQQHVLVGLATSLSRRMSMIQYNSKEIGPLRSASGGILSPQPTRTANPLNASLPSSTSPNRAPHNELPAMDRVESERRKIDAIQRQIEDIKRRNEIERARIERSQQGRLEAEERERRMIEEQRKRYQEELERQHQQLSHRRTPSEDSPFSPPGQSLDEQKTTKRSTQWSAAAVPMSPRGTRITAHEPVTASSPPTTTVKETTTWRAHPPGAPAVASPVPQLNFQQRVKLPIPASHQASGEISPRSNAGITHERTVTERNGSPQLTPRTTSPHNTSHSNTGTNSRSSPQHVSRTNSPRIDLPPTVTESPRSTQHQQAQQQQQSNHFMFIAATPNAPSALAHRGLSTSGGQLTASGATNALVSSQAVPGAIHTADIRTSNRGTSGRESQNSTTSVPTPSALPPPPPLSPARVSSSGRIAVSNSGAISNTYSIPPLSTLGGNPNTGVNNNIPPAPPSPSKSSWQNASSHRRSGGYPPTQTANNNVPAANATSTSTRVSPPKFSPRNTPSIPISVSGGTSTNSVGSAPSDLSSTSQAGSVVHHGSGSVILNQLPSSSTNSNVSTHISKDTIGRTASPAIELVNPRWSASLQLQFRQWNWEDYNNSGPNSPSSKRSTVAAQELPPDDLVPLETAQSELTAEESQLLRLEEESEELRLLGEPSSSPAELAAFVNLKWEDLEMGEPVGRSALGAVRKGFYLGCEVAIKPVAELSPGMDLKAVQRELSNLRDLRHLNIVQFIGVCIHQQRVFLITEFVEGGTMKLLIHTLSIPLPWKLRAAMACDVVKALLFLHRQNMVHRDLKPENILVDSNGRMKLCDLGHTRSTDTSRSRMTRLNDTSILYTSPEMLTGNDYNEKTDVFSFGMILWELLIRREPPARKPASGYQVDPSALESLFASDCPRPLAQIVGQCVSSDASRRPSFRDLLPRVMAVMNVLTN